MQVPVWTGFAVILLGADAAHALHRAALGGRVVAAIR